MAHYAEVVDGKVVRVLVADSQEWCEETLGGVWVQTSYNTRENEHALGGTPLRGNYAGVGYSYLEAEDIFMPPKLFKSWALNPECACWEAPVPKPEGDFEWDESAGDWVAIPEPTE